MAERLCCSKGHKWEPVFPRDAWPPDFRSSCPVCGEPPLGPNDVTATTATVMLVLTLLFACAGGALLFVSENTIPFAVIVLILAGLIPLIGLGIWTGRQRTKKMASVAEAMGFSFMAHLTTASLRAAAPFRLFRQGHSQKALNALLGRVGDCDVVLFEYVYITGSGKSATTWNQTAVMLPDGAAGAPDFQLAPKTFFDKLASLFTHNTVELEDAGEFSGRCKLSGPDPAALRAAFHPDLVHYLGRDGKWFIESVDGQLLLYRRGKLAPEKWPGLVTDALEVRDLLRPAGRRTF